MRAYLILGVRVLTFKVLSNIACRVWALFVVSPLLADWYASKSNNGVARREMFICSKLGQNPSEMEVKTFVRIQTVIWDHLLASKAEIIQKQGSF